MNTKMVHQRKTIIMHKGLAIKWKKFSDVSVHLENSIGDNFQKAFLTNSNNKQCFIELLVKALFSNGHNVLQCRGDASKSVFFTDSDFVSEGENGCLIAPDTDLLIMWIYMWNNTK